MEPEQHIKKKKRMEMKEESVQCRYSWQRTPEQHVRRGGREKGGRRRVGTIYGRDMYGAGSLHQSDREDT